MLVRFTLRELATKPCFDEPEVRIVPPAIGSEDLLVPLGDYGEAAALRFVDGPLQVFDAPRVEYEPAARDTTPIDRDVNDGAERAVVAEPERVYLSRACQHVTGIDLSHRSFCRYDIDAEISDAHALPLRNRVRSTLIPVQEWCQCIERPEVELIPSRRARNAICPRA